MNGSSELPYSKDYMSPLNVIVMIENWCDFALEFYEESVNCGLRISVAEALRIHLPVFKKSSEKYTGVFEKNRRDLLWEIDFILGEWEESGYNDELKRTKLHNRQKKRDEKISWQDEIMKSWFTSGNAILLPEGFRLPRLDVVQKCRERVIERWITLTQVGEFSTTEEIVRWLGYSRIYDARDECLFTGVKLNSPDINVEEDVIETSISIPLLDTRDVPKIRVHKSAMKSKAWVATREGCDYPFPHVAMSRYKKGDLRTQICHVTGVTFQRSSNWLEKESLQLIPVSPQVDYELKLWANKNGSPHGLNAEEWSTKPLQPRVYLEEKGND